MSEIESEAPDYRASLEKVAEAFKALQVTGLNERAIVLLIHDAIGQVHGVNAVTKKAVRLVLEAAQALPDWFCTSAEK